MAAAVEVGLIGLWAIWVGRVLLDVTPWVWPTGREFGLQVQPHHFWISLQRCGTCAWWDGSLNGGAPALADTLAATLHPLVAITTLLFGVVNGAKVTVIGALWMAGIAQWWIARLIGTGRLARMWSSLLVVAAGHLCGRMELGAIGLVVSIATASLCFAAALDVGLGGGRRAAIRLGVIGAMLIVSGHGYLQLGFLGLSPAFLFLLLDKELRLRPPWKGYLLAAGIGVLLAAVLLVPAVHTWPHLTKWLDPSFPGAQLLEYLPLNLVIRDWDYLRGSGLGKPPFPHLNDLYVGWVPVVLGAIGLFGSTQTAGRRRWFLAASLACAFLMASAIPLRTLVRWIPFLGGFRHSTVIASLAVPPLLGLAAIGLDRTIAAPWPRIGLQLKADGPAASLSLSWLLAIPLVGSLLVVEDHSRYGLGATEAAASVVDMQVLRTDSLQWVAPPFGEHFWVELGMEADLKLTDVVKAWWWRDREFPRPRLLVPRDSGPVGLERLGMLGNLTIYKNPNQEYAYVQTERGRIPCQANGRGGNLNVRCVTEEAGQLVVNENNWKGWRAWRDNRRVQLEPGDWLTVPAMAGDHVYEFRYRPWDVWVGLAMSAVGWVLVVSLWPYGNQRGEKRTIEEPTEATTDKTD